MKKTLLILNFFFHCFLSLKAQNTSLPGPVSNPKTVPAGSYVIAMDNTLQANDIGDFNLKAYGLIVYLLNHDVDIQWSIKAGKLKDGIDFTGVADLIKPALVPNGMPLDFKAGPFIIFAEDTAGVAVLIEAFYTENSLTGRNCPNVYRLTETVTNVDIRYDLTGFRPKAAILTDGGNQEVHLAYMDAASIPAESYTLSDGMGLLENCFTFASEPHNGNIGPAVDSCIRAIKEFVMKGGNFLAQCEAVVNYENNVLGRFQTTGGITKLNAKLGTNVTFVNPDLSFSQFEGDYNANAGGSVRNWEIIGSPINNEHNHVIGKDSHVAVIGASVSKHFYDKGGLVFYIGNHSFDESSRESINGLRMYMNAFLTPTNTNCPVLLYTILNVKFTRFSANNQGGETRLSWTVTENEQAKQFSIERSTDGVQFRSIATVPSSTQSGNENYHFTEIQKEVKSYYRIKVTEKQGNEQYSPVISVSSQHKSQPSLKVLSNVEGDDLQIGYSSPKNDILTIQVYTISGAKVYWSKINAFEGMNIITIPASVLNQKGIYIIHAIDQHQNQRTIKIPRL